MAVRLSALCAGRSSSPGRFLVLISIRGWVDPTAIVWLERLGQLKNPMTSSGTEPATFRLVPQCLNKLRYPVPLYTTRGKTRGNTCQDIRLRPAFEHANSEWELDRWTRWKWKPFYCVVRKTLFHFRRLNIPLSKSRLNDIFFVTVKNFKTTSTATMK
jgi:hypothetical protein